MPYKDIVMGRRYRSIPSESFEKTEENIGVKFPYPLYELLKDNDAGAPENYEFLLIFPGEGETSVSGLDAFLSFDNTQYNSFLNKYFNRPEHFPQDERFVPFGMTGNGDYFLFFYEKGKDDPQPKVYYWAHEYSDINGGLVFLAHSFEEFLDMLKPEGYYD